MKYPFSLFLFYYLFVACLQATASSSGPTNTLPIEFVNNSGIITDESQIYIIIKAENPANNNSSFVQIDSQTGLASLVDVTASTIPSSFSYTLAQVPLSGGKRMLYLPYLSSARIYFSLNYPMDLHVTVDVNGNYVIPDPNPFDTTDSNFYTLYDKIELTFDASAGSFANPTAVDFFTLPLQLDQSGSSTYPQSGFTHTRADIITTVETSFSDSNNVTPASQPNWARLFVNYTDPNGVSALMRIVSPSKAIIPGNNNSPYFDDSYLHNSASYGFDYITAINTFYESNSVSIDCTELQSVFEMNPYLLTGSIAGPNSNGIYFFNFTNGNDYSFALEMPTDSFPFYAGAGESFDATNNTPPAIIVRQITAAFDAGLLPAPDQTTLDSTYFQNNKASYYTDNALLSAGSTRPWYDLYSKSLHSMGDLIYTFAYDDALGQDGTLHDTSTITPSTLVVTLGDMTGTDIPNPFSDPNLYTVQNLIGDGTVVYYQGQLVEHLEVLQNVASPFICTVNGQVANIYLHDGFVRPYFQGSSAILVTRSGTNASVTYPANNSVPASPTPVPTTTPTPTVKPLPSGLPTPSKTPTPTATISISKSPTPTPSLTQPLLQWQKNPGGTYSGTLTLPDGTQESFSNFKLPALAIFAPANVQAAIRKEANNILNGL